MKVLFLSDLWDPRRGSMIRQIHALARGLRADGHETLLVSTRQDGEASDEIETEGLRVVRLASRYPVRFRPILGIRNPWVTRPLASILERERPDVVHAHLIHTHLSYHALTLARRARARVVFSAHDAMTFCYQKMDCFHGGEAKHGEGRDLEARWTKCWPCQGLRFLPGRNARIRRIVNRDAHVVTAVSRALAERMIAHGLRVEDVVPNAVTEPKSRPGGTNRWDVGNGPVVLFAGRIQEQKGILRLLGALAVLRSRFETLRLVVAGDRDEWERNAAPHARRLGIEPACTVTGWLDEDGLEDAYAAADLLCVPSTCFETFGLVHLEAQARGLPCVGTIYGGVPEVIEQGTTGFVVNPFDSSDLTGKLALLLEDADLRRKMGKAGRERARREFSMESVFSRWYDHYVPCESSHDRYPCVEASSRAVL